MQICETIERTVVVVVRFCIQFRIEVCVWKERMQVVQQMSVSARILDVLCDKEEKPYLNDTPRDVSMRIRLRNSVGTCVSFFAVACSSSPEEVSEDESSSSLSARMVPDDSSSSVIDSSERSGSISAFEARLYIEAMLASWTVRVCMRLVITTAKFSTSYRKNVTAINKI